MQDIRHRVGIAAPQSRVYQALATTDGIASWWTTDVRGESSMGGKLEFWFGRPTPGAVMEVLELTPDDRVVWRCVEGPDEWVRTTLTFDVRTADDETVLVFTHADWREPVEFMHHCSTKWAYFMLGLKSLLEGGEAKPYPQDLKISSWG